MSRRMIAAVVAAPLVALLLVLASFAPLPYVTYRPGGTLDVLGNGDDGQEIIQVEGHQTYRDAGQLRMTTVIVSQPKQKNSLLELMATWLNGDNAVMPYDAVYQQDETPEENDVEGAAQMVSSQDSAIAVALTELGYKLKPLVEVQGITPGSPADGRLEVRDIFLEVNGTKVTSSDDVSKAVSDASPGEKVGFLVTSRRHRAPRLRWCPRTSRAARGSGSASGRASIFPFDVSVNINPRHQRAQRRADVLAGDLRHPHPRLARPTTRSWPARARSPPTGRSAPSAASPRRSPAPANRAPSCSWCRRPTVPDIEDVNNGDMKLVLAETMHDAVAALEAWAKDRDADLPKCSDLDQRRGAAVTGPTDPELSAALDVDPALAAAVLEIESHIAENGWDQPARLYALVDTAQLVEREPQLAAAMGLDAPSEEGSLTPIEQDQVDPDQLLETRAGADRLARRGHRLRGRGRATRAASGRRRGDPHRPRRGPGVRPRAP